MRMLRASTEPSPGGLGEGRVGCGSAPGNRLVDRGWRSINSRFPQPLHPFRKPGCVNVSSRRYSMRQLPSRCSSRLLAGPPASKHALVDHAFAADVKGQQQNRLPLLTWTAFHGSVCQTTFPAHATFSALLWLIWLQPAALRRTSPAEPPAAKSLRVGKSFRSPAPGNSWCRFRAGCRRPAPP